MADLINRARVSELQHSFADSIGRTDATTIEIIAALMNVLQTTMDFTLEQAPEVVKPGVRMAFQRSLLAMADDI